MEFRKSLSKVHGNTIIDTLLQNAKLNNIKEIVVVTGYNSSFIKNHIENKWFDLNIEFVHNELWNLENGLSVLKAKDVIPKNQEFLISMSDHLYFSDLLEKVIKSDLLITL